MNIPVDLHRFASEIEIIENQTLSSGKVMLYGSSFFAKWRCASVQLSAQKLQIINHGFGGATIDELLYYYPRLVKPNRAPQRL